MRKVVLLFLLFGYSLIRLLGYSSPIFAKVCGEKGDTLEEAKEIEQNCKQRLQQLTSQRKTLSTTLEYLNIQISLTQTQITKTQAELVILEKDIDALGDRIADLNTSLDDLSQILVRHVRGTYSQSRLNDPVYLFFTSKGFTEFINRYQYLKAVQNNDKKIMKAMETSRQNYNIQKTLKEQKQQEVEKLNSLLKQQQTKLTNQQTEKQQLLELTKNDEKRFQQLLAEARAELEAIQSAIAGKGVETEVGTVNTGEKIATITQGKSVCSTGTHVHLEIIDNQIRKSPAEFLKSTNVQWDLCGWFGCDEPFGFSGPLDWPLNPEIRITQGYGMTAYSKTGAYGGGPHTGIDITSSDDTVKTVKSGKLFRGSIDVKNCVIPGTLRYVKVEHDNGLKSYYFHVNY